MHIGNVFIHFDIKLKLFEHEKMWEKFKMIISAV